MTDEQWRSLVEDALTQMGIKPNPDFLYGPKPNASADLDAGADDDDG
ncbi:hypothetical protein JDN40_15080 [Rhodomicrobium vannielii ATCC 17100]|nr:hypothetical protein [Rhodomicrobium vannielii]MBJ7535431.1 hypothetical protein [Rhodomicrobium vannielii ATCC 17100]